MESLDKNGKEVFDHLLKFAKAKSLPIRWGTKGFSMNVDKNGVHVAICFGYPPQSVFKQSVYTGFGGAGGLLSKLNVEESLLEEIRTEAQATGLFQPAGRELKVIINRRYDEKEIQSLIVWLEKMATTIECHELK